MTKTITPKAGKNFWSDRPVLVTGATGLLGPWLVRELLARGAKIVTIIRDSVPGSELNRAGLDRRVDAVPGDIADYQAVERVINEYEVETIFNLAAQTIVLTANRNPISTFEANIRGAWNVLEAARRCPTVKRVVMASSDKAYGDQPKLPYEETARLEGRHPYDVSKSCADLLSRAYFETYNLPVCVTRCGNFYGGGDLNFSRIVPGTIRSVLRGERPVLRSDGSFIRDYLYVEDAARAYLKLAEGMTDKKVLGEAFNFSAETKTTVRGLVDQILKLMGRTDLKPVILSQAKGEIKHQYLRAAKARRLLGWKPSFTQEEGLRRTIAWYRAYLGAAPNGR